MRDAKLDKQAPDSCPKLGIFPCGGSLALPASYLAGETSSMERGESTLSGLLYLWKASLWALVAPLI